MGVKNAEYTNSEKSFSKARRSIVAKNKIKKGQVLTEDNLTTKRPLLENCIPAIEYYSILGKKAQKDIAFDEILKIGDVK